MTRIQREKHVLGKMIGIWCRKHHHTPSGDLCSVCLELLDYSLARLDSCPNGENKSSCRKCKVHCYSPRHRQAIRHVMRHVAPLMIFRHPLLSLKHLL